MDIYFCFKNRNMVAVILNKEENFKPSLEYDFVIVNPKDADSQIEKWCSN